MELLVYGLVRNKEIVQAFWLASPHKRARYLIDDSTWHLTTSIGQRQFSKTRSRGAYFAQAAADVSATGN
jgi:hypothetical protein